MPSGEKSFNFPTPEKTAPQSEEHAQKHRAVMKIAGPGIHRISLSIPEDIDIADQRDLLLSRLEERFAPFAPQRRELAASIFAHMRAGSLTNRQELERSIAEQFSTFVADNFSFEELETLAKADYMERGYATVNRLLAYEIKGDVLEVHIPAVFLQGNMEFIRLWEDGMHKIAALLKTESSFAHIKNVGGSSWLCFKNPYLFEKMGFTVMWRDEKEEWAYIEISREAFLERYGSTG